MTLLPVPNALVSFVQDRKVIGQAVTNTRGMFAIKGLTPWGVYSVIVASKDYVATLATVARPYDHDQSEPEEGVSSKQGWVNEIQFVAFLPAEEAAADADASADSDPAMGDDAGEEPPADDEDDGAADDYTDYEFNVIQTIPREDFIMALREGLYGFDVSSLPPPTSAGGAGAGGAGGGGVGDVVGPAVIGAAIGAGVGAAIGASESDGDRASPFRP